MKRNPIDVVNEVSIMLRTSEKKSIAENYVTSLYANEKIDSRLFEYCIGMIEDYRNI